MRNRRAAALATLLLTLSSLPVARAQVTGLSGRSQRGRRGDTDVAGEEVTSGGPRVPWKGTALKWSHALTTTTVGVGRNIQSESAEIYSQGYWLLINYYLVDREGGNLRFSTSPGFDVEYTNSNVTTDLREPQLRDLNASLIGNVPLYMDSDKGVAIVGVPNATVLFPTSEPSRKSGTYLFTSPRFTVVEQFTPRGVGDFPKSIAFGQTLRWDYRMSRATEPVSPTARIPAQSATGSPITTNQFSGSRFARHRLYAGGFVAFSGKLFERPFQLVAAASLVEDFLPRFDENVCVQTATGCAEPRRGDQPPANRLTSGAFAIEAQYFPFPEWGFALGYQNNGNQLAPSGQRRPLFYSPAAAFTARFMLSLDAIYEALSGPRRASPFFLPG